MDGSAAMLQHGGGGSESSGATAGDSNAMLLENLLPVLMQTFAQVLLGYLAARRKLMPPAGTGGLGRFAAAFALPALVFQNMAVLNLGAASVGLVLGLLAAKGIVAAIVAVLTLVLVEGDTRSWSLAALFAMLTTSQSDFAIGLPILNALYPPPVLPPECQFMPQGGDTAVGNDTSTQCEPQLAYSDYLYIGAPNSLLVINPLCFALLELANAVSRARLQAGEDSQQPLLGCCFVIKQVVIPTLTSPLVMSVLLGILVNVSGVPVPVFFTAVLQSVGASYSSLALFCLGFSLWEGDSDSDDDDSQQQQQDQPEPEQQQQRQLRQPPRDAPEFGWVQPALLVGAKSVLLPVLARIIVMVITGSEEYSRFAFVCTTFPSSPSVALFAVQFGLPIADVRRISRTTIVGTVASAFIVLATAQMVMVDGSAAKLTAVLQTAEETGWGALAGSSWVLVVASSMLLSRNTPGWRLQYMVWSVFFLAFSQVTFLTLTAVCTPESFRLHHPTAATHCTLAIEVFSTGARIWGVILLVADVHRTHRHVATGIIWRALRAGKKVVLWSAWLLPGLWAVGLWASGLWGELQLSCFSCFNASAPDSAINEYRLLSSLLAAVLAAIAVGVLVWAQTHQRRHDDRDDEQQQQQQQEERQLDAALLADDDSALSLSDSESESLHGAAPIWLPVQVRVVGLCNLLGLLFQVAVGFATLLGGSSRADPSSRSDDDPSSAVSGSAAGGEVSLEILALNRTYCL